VVRVGILGCGGIARAHAAAYRQLAPRCRIVAVADVFPEQAERLAAELDGLGAGAAGTAEPVAVCRDPETLLERPDVDLVSICTPPFEHARLTISALQAGKHVLVEKPMATSLAECDAMIAAAGRAGRILCVVHQNRFRAEYTRLQALVAAGLLGPLDYVGVHCLWWRGPAYYRLWWRGTWDKEGGGALLNHAIHAVDLLCWIVGLPEEVEGRLATRAHDVEVEDLALAILRWPGGTLGQLSATVAAHLGEDRFEVCGRRAAVAVPWRVAAQADTGNGFGRRDEAVVAELEAAAAAVPVSALSGHAAQVDRLLTALERGGPPPVPGEEARRAVELVTAVYASVAEGGPCRLPLDPDHPCYTTEGLRAHMRRALGR
jgi:UDP-N-acetyl-2-amino-2-deoxyglucuronate dehydrogenase